jgi:hypothetical protein
MLSSEIFPHIKTKTFSTISKPSIELFVGVIGIVVHIITTSIKATMSDTQGSYLFQG